MLQSKSIDLTNKPTKKLLFIQQNLNKKISNTCRELCEIGRCSTQPNQPYPKPPYLLATSKAFRGSTFASTRARQTGHVCLHSAWLATPPRSVASRNGPAHVLRRRFRWHTGHLRCLDMPSGTPPRRPHTSTQGRRTE